MKNMKNKILIITTYYNLYFSFIIYIYYNIYIMSYGKVSEGPSGFIKPFSSTKYVDGTQEFLSSNSIVAKFAFLL